MTVTEIERRLADSRYEENKINQVETLYKLNDILKSGFKKELEETKRKYEEDVAEIQLRNKYYLNKLLLK